MYLCNWLNPMFRRSRLELRRWLTVPAPKDGGGIDRDFAEGWIRQEQRLKEAIARVAQANSRTAPPEQRFGEWVDGWMSQQQRLREAFAIARNSRTPRTSKDARDQSDEWVDGWVRQQQRVRQALAAAKPAGERTVK